MRQHLAVYLLCFISLGAALGLCQASDQGSNLTENASAMLSAIQNTGNASAGNITAGEEADQVWDGNSTSSDENATVIITNSGSGRATLISPKGAVTARTVSFVWGKVDGSTSYRLWIDKPREHIFDRWYQASEVTSGSVCTIMPVKKLEKGTYSWKIQTKSSEGVGPWSNSMQFSISPPPAPGKTTLISPTGTISNSTPTFTWRTVDRATEYQLYISGPSGRVFKQWYKAREISSGSICSVTSNKTLEKGAYSWKVQTLGDGGEGPWSSEMNFEVTNSKKWTYMVYLDGDNNLEKFAIINFLQMAAVGSNKDVNIVAQFDRIPGYDDRYGDWITGKRFYITKDMTPTAENAVADIGEPDMGNPKTLTEFINWTKKSYPASNYCLVMWNHGGGWRHYLRLVPWSAEDVRPDGTPAGKGVCWDDTSKTVLTMQKVGSSLAASPVSLVNYDACLMQMLEISYEDSPNARVHVGSEELVPGTGQPYDAILKDLAAKPTMTPEDLGSAIVKRYMVSYLPGTNQNISFVTISAVRDDKPLQGLVKAVDSLALALIGVEPEEYSHIQKASIEADHYDTPSFIDIFDFARLIKLYVPNSTVASAAQNVMDGVNASVISEAHGKKHVNAHGISFFLPEDASGYLLSYESTRFAQDTHWDEFIKKHLRIGTAFDESFTGSALPDKWIAAHGNWSVGERGLYSGDMANSWQSIYYNSTFNDFTYEAQVYRGGDSSNSNSRDAGNPNAIIVKGNPSVLCGNTSGGQGYTWDTAYYFQYARSGKYSIWKSKGSCAWQWIQPWTESPAINKGDAWNILKVTVRGNRTYFWINDLPMRSFEDDSFASGKVGLGYYAGEGDGFRVSHAILVNASPIDYGLRSGNDAVSEDQMKLNEEALNKSKNVTQWLLSPVQSQ